MPNNSSEPEWLDRLVDQVLADEAEMPKPGRPAAEWHAPAFAEMETLINTGMSLREAAETVSQSPAPWRTITVTAKSLRFMFQRHIRQQFADTAGQAVVDDDEAAFVAAFRALRERDGQDGNRKSKRRA